MDIDADSIFNKLIEVYNKCINIKSIKDPIARFTKDDIIKYLSKDDFCRTIFRCNIDGSVFVFNNIESKLLVNYLDCMIVQGLFEDYFDSYKRYFSVMVVDLNCFNFINKNKDKDNLNTIVKEVTDHYKSRGFMCSFDLENTPTNIYLDEENNKNMMIYTFRLYYGYLNKNLDINDKTNFNLNFSSNSSCFYHINNPVITFEKMSENSDKYISIKYHNDEIGRLPINFKIESLYYKYYHTKIHDALLKLKVNKKLIGEDIEDDE